MQGELSCPLCNFQYCQQKTPRMLGMCGHTFCEGCIGTLILPSGEDGFTITCPEDDASCKLQNNNAKQFPVNKALMKIIDSNKSKTSFKDSSFDVSKIVKQQQLQQDQQTKQLISAIKESQQLSSEQAQISEPKNDSNDSNTQTNKEPTVNGNQNNQNCQNQAEEQGSEEDDNLCLLHQKPLEIVCVVDLEKICAKCALFGKHKGHDFKSIEQIDRENNQFYHSLLAVYDEKAEILNRVEKKETKSDILAILNTNKQTMAKQVKDRFKKLIDTIKSQEKKALSKLEKICQKIEKDVDDLYNIDFTLVEKYEEWEKLSFQKLQIIEKGSFEEKLELLLVDQAKRDKNIIVQGKSLIDEMKSREDCIINKAEVLLTNFNMKTSDKIFEFTQSFVEIYDKPPEPEKIQQTRSLPTIEDINQNENLIEHSEKKLIEDDLLDIGEQALDRAHQKKLLFNDSQYESVKKQEVNKQQEPKYTVNFQVKSIEEKSTHRHSIRKNTEPLPYDNKKHVISHNESSFQSSLKQDSFVCDKVIRPTKKKLKSIKVPQKYEKVLESVYADTVQTFDLTNAELGDNIILQLCEFIPGTKIKTVKFIRNKLTDDCILKMLPYISGIITLNLSQNNLTERVLDIFIEHRDMLPKVKNIILSLNKIIERKHKGKIEELRKLDIVVSV